MDIHHGRFRVHLSLKSPIVCVWLVWFGWTIHLRRCRVFVV